jgi:uncharacterized protein YgiM (DUF1202 family)
MKKSHRKDVIIARIIFAFILLVLVILIAVGINAVWKYTAGSRQQEQTGTETESKTPEDTESETVADDLEQWVTDNSETEETEEPVTEEEPTPEDGGEAAQTILRAQYSVNVRTGPGTGYSVIGGIDAGREVVLLEEDEYGWGYIQDGDLTGYVYLEYFLIVE